MTLHHGAGTARTRTLKRAAWTPCKSKLVDFFVCLITLGLRS